MRRVFITAALMGLVSAPAWADMRPGMYQITANSAGMPQPQSQSQCMTPQDAHDPITPLVTGGDPGCSLTNRSESPGRYITDFACQTQGQQVNGHADFTLGPDSFTGTITATGPSQQGSPQTMTTTISGRRTGDCR